MASYHGNPPSESPKKEQIITEFFTKSLHIILESRCAYVSSRNYSGDQFLLSPSPSSSSSSSSSCPPRDKWFNIALRDCPAALENIDFWRQSNLEPMIVDIVLVRRPNDWNFSGKGRLDCEEAGCLGKTEKIIERWVIQYESKKTVGNCGFSSGSSSKRSSGTSSITLYKKTVLLFRSLYATVRLLPAYKLFRDLIASAQIRLYNLSHRVSSFVEPFTRREEADMKRFEFTPIETSCGRLCLSVLYQTSILDLSSEPSTPISPQFIPEYVGSPMAEPLKRFPSGPVSRSSPSSYPFGRHHSWSYDLYRASPPSYNPSPSPTYSESRDPLSKHHHLRPPPVSLPRQLQHKASEPHVKNPSHDEYWLSPTFSVSPPAHNAGGNIHKVLLRCESAPVSIPPKLPAIPPLPNNQIVHPSPQIGGTRSFSRSSSKLLFQDEYDDSEFSGPFVVYDDETVNPGSRQGSLDPSGNSTKPRAAVGQLVHMLKKAPPLHHQSTTNLQISQGSKLEASLYNYESSSLNSKSSEVVMSKTIADALKELREYSEMKEKLLKQGKSYQS